MEGPSRGVTRIPVSRFPKRVIPFRFATWPISPGNLRSIEFGQAVQQKRSWSFCCPRFSGAFFCVIYRATAAQKAADDKLFNKGDTKPERLAAVLPRLPGCHYRFRRESGQACQKISLAQR